MELGNRARNYVRKYLWIGPVMGAVIGTGAVVYAAVPHAFVNNTEVLTAENLNANFSALDARSDLVGTGPADGTSNAVLVSPTRGTDLVYPSAAVTLTAGTWLVEAFASVSTTDNSDAVQLGLVQGSAAVDVANSRGGIAVVSPTALGALHTAKVMTVNGSTLVQMKAFRNGASTLQFGAALALVGPMNRIMAVRLR